MKKKVRKGENMSEDAVNGELKFENGNVVVRYGDKTVIFKSDDIIGFSVAPISDEKCFVRVDSANEDGVIKRVKFSCDHETATKIFRTLLLILLADREV